VHGTAGTILLVGDALHNLTDGVVIAASFLNSVTIGIVASLSVIAHEIPQELGDFAILLQSGYSKKRALAFNLLSSLTTIPGAIIAYFALESVQVAIPYAMALSAATFLYIALADLTPELHRKTRLKSTTLQFLLMLVGILTILLFLQFHP
jgi:zinc and cadmium transporter